MLAVVGFLVQGSGIHLPGALYETSNPIDAFFTILKSDYPINPWIQIILGIGYLEWTNHDGKISMNDMHEGSDREVGEFKAETREFLAVCESERLSTSLVKRVSCHS